MNEEQVSTEQINAEQINTAQTMTPSLVVENLFDDKVMVELPEGTTIMPEDMVRQLYPYEKRPQHIYYQSKDVLYFTFSLLKQPLADKQVSEATYRSLQVIESAYPKSIIDQVKFANIASEQRCGWFAYQSPSLREPRYNIICILSVNNQFMHGTCSCLLEDEKSKNRIKQVLLSLQITEKGSGQWVNSPPWTNRF